MICTNGKIVVIVGEGITDESFAEFIGKSNELANEFYGTKDDVYFTLQNEPILSGVIKEGISFPELKEIYEPIDGIIFRGIGDSELTWPGTVSKTVKHYYSQEEKEEIADEFCNEQMEKEKLEIEKKNISKSYGDRINQKEEMISELAKKHQMGYEDRQKSCILTLNFEEGKKYYSDKDSGELLHTEDMTPMDRQLSLEIDPKFHGVVVQDDSFETPEELENATEERENSTDEDGKTTEETQDDLDENEDHEKGVFDGDPNESMKEAAKSKKSGRKKKDRKIPEVPDNELSEMNEGSDKK